MSDEQQKKALVEQAKALFIKLVKSELIQLFVKYGLKMTGAMGTAASLVAGIAAKYFWKILYKLGIITAEKIETKKELDEYDKKIHEPTATPEDIKKAGKDFLSN